MAERSRRGRSLLLVPLLALATGCHVLGLLGPAKEKGPDKPPVAAAPGEERVALPSKFQVRKAPVLFLSDFKLADDLPLFKELEEMRDAVLRELLLPPPRYTVTVYIFEGEKDYKAYLRQSKPDLHRLGRRAYFVAEPRGAGKDYLVYTYFSKRIRQDLRHELTHALLNSVVKDVPQWLDEGLAETFELPPEKGGVNAEHVERLRADIAAGKQRLSLDRLEKLTEVEQMAPAEYREAWAWVHLLMHSKTEAKNALLSHLSQLRGKHPPGPLGPKLAKLFSSPEEALMAHLARLEADLAKPGEQARR
ncbi:MAG: DUF1570 domain-containing protein [Gemmataceae bacterium]|nr:DUF1570 domain-containing protein [Gemmataceae bacterium]